MKRVRQSAIYLLFFVLPLVTACDDKSSTVPTPETRANEPVPALPENPLPEQDAAMPPQAEFAIDNRNYLFDISDHTQEEMESLLLRAEEISELNMEDYPDLEIVMILHGPDIDWFNRKNYESNRQLVDLAEKLDAFDIIDMKVCERTMNKHGLKREDIPSFIESVPYAPDEILRLQEQDYIKL